MPATALLHALEHVLVVGLATALGFIAWRGGRKHRRDLAKQHAAVCSTIAAMKEHQGPPALLTEWGHSYAAPAGEGTGLQHSRCVPCTRCCNEGGLAFGVGRVDVHAQGV